MKGGDTMNLYEVLFIVFVSSIGLGGVLYGVNVAKDLTRDYYRKSIKHDFEVKMAYERGLKDGEEKAKRKALK